ncbi:hypothetical protein CISIN_1g048022mg [Citrus sinensis]|uniref:Uncharacterized protein n=1 Tax=Citrus sinensis TaxID=2711 RepID=A0A067FN94_CITSI|nr:hypothetical protein CISIN_1g048022mg [Citrus sinensis]
MSPSSFFNITINPVANQGISFKCFKVDNYSNNFIRIRSRNINKSVFTGGNRKNEYTTRLICSFHKIQS